MTPAAYEVRAADIEKAADAGTDAEVKAAAAHLGDVSDGVRTGSLSLGDLSDAEQAMLRACSAAGY
jgi:hypothetical protein